jgi:bacillopeptidase F (M6 metalloprotease family)
VQQWQNPQNLWSATTERFVSPPSSITDSPNSNYLRNTSATFVQSKFIEIPKEAFRATLRFRAWWELESDKDYVQLSVSTDGTNFQPLCGNYTRTAFNGSALGQPIYDGFNTEWIYENVDLTPYIGKNIKLQWKIVSNESIQYEGFYFDDMDITVVNSTATFTQFLSDNDFILNQNNPNPTEGVTHINYLFTTDKKDNIQLLVTDISGKIIFKYKVQDVDNHNIALNTEGWQPGIYFYWMDINGKRTTVKKLVKI